jgi:pimeloyl-ACP methyl ester carboxylesterase
MVAAVRGCCCCTAAGVPAATGTSSPAALVRAAAHQAVQSSLAPMAATLTAHLREVMRSVDELDLFEVYRQVRCPVVIVTGQRCIAELLPAQAQEPWMAYERWVQVQLDRAAADNPAVTLVRLPTGHDPHLEAPEAVASLIHRYGAGG